jgi:hypothetical protein
MSQLWHSLGSLFSSTRKAYLPERAISRLGLPGLTQALEAEELFTHAARKAATSKEVAMPEVKVDFDAEKVNELLDIVLRTKDTVAWLPINKAATVALAVIAAELEEKATKVQKTEYERRA